MTYLELCQKLCQKVGIGNTLSTVTGQTGELARVTSWIDEAYLDIQTAHQDWDWMRTSASWTTTGGQSTYTTAQCGIAAGTFGMWDVFTFRNYITSSGVTSEYLMQCIGYDVWRDRYKFGAIQTVQTRPIEAAVAPDKSVCLGPFPSDGYTITCDYFTAPVSMVNDSDVPTLPAQFHMAIVYKAMEYYALYQSAPEVLQDAQMQFFKYMARLRKDRTPMPKFAGALC